MTNGIVRFIKHVPGNGSAGPQAENQIFRFESRANDDGSHEILVLLVHLCEVRAMACGKNILAWGHGGEGKQTLLIGNFDAAGIRRVGSVWRICRIYGNEGARQRLLGDGVNNPAADSKRGRRSEEHTSELQSHLNLVCRLLLEKKKKKHPPRARMRQHLAAV